ncbi:hypothetical protein CAPTEDRAFT_196246 [Capitella teleta]|uniref:G-protein coupled receptors family 1 profile domain-containing protein n=1 Tax=Capitella teleta TaxID=283909 RepID=R7TZ28_CAPTE|nr:hypothetical protein CAPTEDRAFT_196246 [Capitella teleta]|eukprot:ELT99188.1 hypothetical protein CAPTEDRAFT_196246 [Capitella teleta]
MENISQTHVASLTAGLMISESVLAVVMNSLTITAIVKGNLVQKSVSHLFIASLIFVDLLCGVSMLSTQCVSMVYAVFGSSSVLVIVTWTNAVINAMVFPGSLFISLVIGLDRAIATTHPLKYKSILTHQRGFTLLTVIAIFIFLTVVPAALLNVLTLDEIPVIMHPTAIYPDGYTTFFTSPLIFSLLVANSLFYLKVLGAYKRTLTRYSTNNRLTMRSRKLTKTAMLTVLILIVCWLPLAVITAMPISCVNDVTYHSVFIVVVIPTFANNFIYAWNHRDFRRACSTCVLKSLSKHINMIEHEYSFTCDCVNKFSSCRVLKASCDTRSFIHFIMRRTRSKNIFKQKPKFVLRTHYSTWEFYLYRIIALLACMNLLVMLVFSAILFTDDAVIAVPKQFVTPGQYGNQGQNEDKWTPGRELALDTFDEKDNGTLMLFEQLLRHDKKPYFVNIKQVQCLYLGIDVTETLVQGDCVCESGWHGNQCSIPADVITASDLIKGHDLNIRDAPRRLVDVSFFGNGTKDWFGHLNRKFELTGDVIDVFLVLWPCFSNTTSCRTHTIDAAWSRVTRLLHFRKIRRKIVHAFLGNDVNANLSNPSNILKAVAENGFDILDNLKEDDFVVISMNSWDIIPRELCIFLKLHDGIPEAFYGNGTWIGRDISQLGTDSQKNMVLGGSVDFFERIEDYL